MFLQGRARRGKSAWAWRGERWEKGPESQLEARHMSLPQAALHSDMIHIAPSIGHSRGWGAASGWWTQDEWGFQACLEEAQEGKEPEAQVSRDTAG